MSTKFRILWAAWALCAVVVFVGTLLMRVASRAEVVSLKLTPGAVVTLSSFRLSGSPVVLALGFQRHDGSRRPELGSSAFEPASDGRQFKDPGAEVLLKVTGLAQDALFTAYPASGFAESSIWRNLFPVVPGRAFPWPPAHAQAPNLSAGQNTLAVRVVSVDPRLSGEAVSLVLKPPLEFKSHLPGYGGLWFFFFWPTHAAVLAVAGALLLWRSRRASARGAMSAAAPR